MAYSKTVWADRSVQRPLTYTQTVNGDGSITMTPAEGTILVAGTPLSAANLNKMEAGIEFAESGSILIPVAGTNTLTGTVPGLTSLSQLVNKLITIKAAADNGGTATTINFSGLGAKNFYKPGGTAAPTLKAGKAYTVWYDGTSFFVKASAEGDATAGNVLAGKYFSNDSDTYIPGTMPSYADSTEVAAISSPEGVLYLGINAGAYLNASGFGAGIASIRKTDANFKQSNIKSGTTVLGMPGTCNADPKPTKTTPLYAVQLKADNSVTDVLAGATFTQRQAPTVNTYMDTLTKQFYSGVWTVKPWALPSQWTIHQNIIVRPGIATGNMWSFGYHANGQAALLAEFQYADGQYALCLYGQSMKSITIPLTDSQVHGITVTGDTATNTINIYINGRWAGSTTGLPFSTGTFDSNWGLCVGANMAYDYGYLLDNSYGRPNQHATNQWWFWNTILSAELIARLNDVGTVDRTYLYDYGDTKAALTGGWKNLTSSNGAVVVQPTYYQISTSADAGYTGIETIGSVNVAGAKYICVEFAGTRTSSIPTLRVGYGGTNGVHNSFVKMQPFPRPTLQNGNPNGSAVLRCKLDWQELNHKVKISLYGGTGSIYVYRIWLE